MPSLPALTIYLFGLTALAAGIFTVFGPQPASCAPEAQANGLAAIAVGSFYILAAAQENKSFFFLTLATRALTTVVFWRNAARFGGKWGVAAVWEGGGAVLTTGALWVGGWRGTGRV
ncbi:hypothetical protein BU23DRAFT_659576 [Bimuria novae-zelandiae CBS 107.79]|uniref:Uncharacterized protein n=1 Tax=Bimuria novae-zelandiae CBS 107.79 TaxID=1447943 RepID=A0A6A5VR13_9PLEO|nr:hypothetical protein BU23DRAFT_659576 [Bimuria novae-zelandiae CBS 107.79]